MSVEINRTQDDFGQKRRKAGPSDEQDEPPIASTLKINANDSRKSNTGGDHDALESIDTKYLTHVISILSKHYRVRDEVICSDTAVHDTLMRSPSNAEINNDELNFESSRNDIGDDAYFEEDIETILNYLSTALPHITADMIPIILDIPIEVVTLLIPKVQLKLLPSLIPLLSKCVIDELLHALPQSTLKHIVPRFSKAALVIITPLLSIDLLPNYLSLLPRHLLLTSVPLISPEVALPLIPLLPLKILPIILPMFSIEILASVIPSLPVYVTCTVFNSLPKASYPLIIPKMTEEVLPTFIPLLPPDILFDMVMLLESKIFFTVIPLLPQETLKTILPKLPEEILIPA